MSAADGKETRAMSDSKRGRGPISPSEVAQLAGYSIPEEVFEAFNEAIAAAWDGRQAVVSQPKTCAAAVDKLRARMPDIQPGDLYNRNWLDVEQAYRAKGWRVVYNKPNYNKTYPATFTFSKGRQR